VPLQIQMMINLKDSHPTPHTLFSPWISFIALILKFGTRFPKFFFFCLEYEFQNVFSEVFDEFELEKLQKNHSGVFVQG
jgi:hypothetical protein